MPYSPEDLEFIEETERRLKLIPEEWVIEFAADCSSKQIKLMELPEEIVMTMWNAFVRDKGYGHGQIW